MTRDCLILTLQTGLPKILVDDCLSFTTWLLPAPILIGQHTNSKLNRCHSKNMFCKYNFLFYLNFRFGKDVRIVHFIGSPKPWQASEASAFQRPVPGDHIGRWWSIFVSPVLPYLSSDMVGCSFAQSQSGIIFPQNLRFTIFKIEASLSNLTMCQTNL